MTCSIIYPGQLFYVLGVGCSSCSVVTAAVDAEVYFFSVFSVSRGFDGRQVR